MFFNIAKDQVQLYKESIKEFIIKGNSIIEFCQTPLLDDKYDITLFERKQLKNLISEVEKIVNKLKELQKH